MAVQDFVYQRIELYKSDSLGSGSYGGVCRAKCDGVPCAAKIMHPTLFDLRDPGTASYLERFESECHLLSLARHPNIVQYLTTYRDPETRLPVLLMELCDESLCRFLERSPGPLPYHIELNIGHDIALALVYLHSNGLIHRDLTGNNVLMIAGVRAKVTDFGMSKLANINPRITPMTLCPGNLQYMSPEALEEPPSYTEKLDIFSFGVLLVQIMTMQFPHAGPRFQSDPRYPDENVRVIVSETQRRSTHLKLISDTYPLKPMALNCLKGKEKERPSAQQLSKLLYELKRAPQYSESIQQTQTCEGNGQEVGSLRRQVQDLQQRDQELRQEIERLRLLESHDEEVKDTTRALHAGKQLVAQLQKSVEEKDRAIEELQQTISAQERNILQLEQQVRAIESQAQQSLGVAEVKPPDAAEMQQVTIAPPTKEEISKLILEEVKKAPEKMRRGVAVADGNTIFINPGGTHDLYSCQNVSGEQHWSTLQNNHFILFGLAVVDGLLTSIGGCTGYGTPRTSTLLSLTGESKKQQWYQLFPSMPTARSNCASVTAQQALIVAGGEDGSRAVDIVEVMTIPTKQWATAARLPNPFSAMMPAVCGDQLYLGGGYVRIGGGNKASKSVLACSLSDLLQPQSLGTSPAKDSPVWHHTKVLPVSQCAITPLAGHLLAIGGKDDLDKLTADVQCYDPTTNTWETITKIVNPRYCHFTSVLPEDQLIVVGGFIRYGGRTDSVELGTVPTDYVVICA